MGNWGELGRFEEMGVNQLGHCKMSAPGILQWLILFIPLLDHQFRGYLMGKKWHSLLTCLS